MGLLQVHPGGERVNAEDVAHGAKTHTTPVAAALI